MESVFLSFCKLFAAAAAVTAAAATATATTATATTATAAANDDYTRPETTTNPPLRFERGSVVLAIIEMPPTYLLENVFFSTFLHAVFLPPLPSPPLPPPLLLPPLPPPPLTMTMNGLKRQQSRRVETRQRSPCYRGTRNS